MYSSRVIAQPGKGISLDCFESFRQGVSPSFGSIRARVTTKYGGFRGENKGTAQVHQYNVKERLTLAVHTIYF
jgi:hypothetical protein